MKKHRKAGLFKFSFILTLVLAAMLPVNAQTTSSSKENVLSAIKDSVVTEKKVVQTPVSGIQGSKPAYDQPNKEGVYMMIEKMPQYPGGEKALLDYISQNMKYPLEAQQKGIQGKILIRFVVNKVGKVERAEVVRGLEPSIDKEGLRVINSLPNWIPGEQKGEKVSVYYTIPITFQLTGGFNVSTAAPKKMPIYVLNGKVLPKGFDISTINRDSVTVNLLKADTETNRTYLITKYGEQAANGVIEMTKKSTAKVLSSTKDSISVDKKKLKTSATDLKESKHSVNQPDKDNVYLFAPKMPQFPGGEKELSGYISTNLLYPLEA